MKNLFLSFLLLIFFSFASAQISNNDGQSDLRINRKKWSYKIYPRLDQDISTDIFKANDQRREDVQAARQNIESNKSRVAQGLPTISPPTSNRILPDTVLKENIFSPPGYYLYEMNITNSGQKTISSITWNYVFFDIAKNREAGRQVFIVNEKIAPGKTKTVSGKSNAYPTGTVDASYGNKKFQDVYSENIYIQRIEYSDGSVWSSPVN